MGTQSPKGARLKKKTFLVQLKLPPGAWQLYWVDQLVKVPQAAETPSVVAFLRKVWLSSDLQILRRGKAVQRVEFPITDLPILPLGTVFDDHRVIPHLPLDDTTWPITTSLNFNRLNCWPAEWREIDRGGSLADLLSDKGRLEVPRDQYHGVFLVVGGQKDEDHHIFPCSAIFQFFWARSSLWAQLLVDGRFLDYDRYIFSRELSHLDGSGTSAKVWLRQWMVDDDAGFIATLAFDEAALKAGSNIYRHLVQPGNDDAPRCLRAEAPYQGLIPVTVLRRRIRLSSGEHVWYVQGIMSSGYTSNIKHVWYDRDNDGRPPIEISALGDQKLPIHREQRRFGGPLVTTVGDVVKLNHLPHLSGVQPTNIEVDWLTQRFPDLEDDMEVTKLPQTETQYRNTAEARQRLQMWLDEISTLKDSSSAAELVPQGVLTGGDTEERRRNEQMQDELDRESPIRGDAISMAATLLGQSGTVLEIRKAKWNLKVEPVVAGRPSATVPFFLVPEAAASDKRKAWRYRDKANKASKRAICLRLELTSVSGNDALVRYLLDFEEREGQNQNRFLIFRNASNTVLEAEHATVAEIVSRMGQAQTTKVELSIVIARLRNHPPMTNLAHFWSELVDPNFQPRRSSERGQGAGGQEHGL